MTYNQRSAVCLPGAVQWRSHYQGQIQAMVPAIEIVEILVHAMQCCISAAAMVRRSVQQGLTGILLPPVQCSRTLVPPFSILSKILNLMKMELCVFWLSGFQEQLQQ